MKERIYQLIEALGISSRQFSLSIGKSESFARTIKNTIGADVIGDILRVYPHVNIYWLITGDGEIFNDKSKTGSNNGVIDSESINISQHIKVLEDKINILQETIDSQKETINAQKTAIDLLKEKKK